MQISVVKDDGLVYVDGQAHNVKLDDLPDYIHAIQWDSAKKVGHIEYKADSRGVHHPNTKLVDFSEFEYLVDRWRIKKKEKDDEAEALTRRTEAEIEATKRAQLVERGKQEQVRKPVKNLGKMK